MYGHWLISTLEQVLDQYQKGIHTRSAKEALGYLSRALDLYRRAPGSPPPSPGSLDREILTWMAKACLAMVGVLMWVWNLCCSVHSVVRKTYPK